MTPEDRQIAEAIGEDGVGAIIIGQEVLYPPLQVGGKAFHFDAYRRRFIYALQHFGGNLEKACKFVDRPIEWAHKFIASRKFREFRAAILAMRGVNNGDLAGWWLEFGLDGARGYREWYEGVCLLCHEKNKFSVTEMEMMRDDNMTLKPNCTVCLQPMGSEEVEYRKEEFKPSREQVQFWSEIGNRVSPKIERVQHQFTNETISFVSASHG